MASTWQFNCTLVNLELDQAIHIPCFSSLVALVCPDCVPKQTILKHEANISTLLNFFFLFHHHHYQALSCSAFCPQASNYWLPINFSEFPKAIQCCPIFQLQNILPKLKTVLSKGLDTTRNNLLKFNGGCKWNFPPVTHVPWVTGCDDTCVRY